MNGNGGFAVELILFGMIAAFLVLRLRSILGRRQGFERQQDPRPADAPQAGGIGATVVRPLFGGGAAAPAPSTAPARDLPASDSPTGRAFAEFRRIEPGFDPARFLAGAEKAFEMIVASFAAGRREELRPLLSDEMYAAFEGAISTREQAGETQRSEIKSIHAARIENAELRGALASVSVRFVSDQVSVTMGSNGVPVAGADAVTEMTDLWTFERALGSADPAWRLVAARSA